MPETRRNHNEYAAKVVCGVVKEKGPLNLGLYFTAVNVHNPSTVEAVFCVKLAIARPGAGGSISGYHKFALKPDQALEIDCEMIRKIAGGLDFVKGFVVIKCKTELDVVAVYTAGSLETGHVATMHSERVPVRVLAAPMPDC
ncbi:MAG: hypothetical protein KC420_00695 [Myxococcales bacterium]|nr:hypothetical protein [Myxococcales bacterium]MCB9567863.1 hypothetical protein [Myxococcales bacterium]MCB9700308.1 hypothetical protein [Myxococcales bacterium]